MNLIETLDNAYDKGIHPLVMKAVNAIGLGDKKPDPHSANTVWKQQISPKGSRLRVMQPETTRDDFFRSLGKLSIGAAGVGGTAALISSLGHPVKLTSPSRQTMTVPLTADEQKILLGKRDSKEKKKKDMKKLGSSETNLDELPRGSYDVDTEGNVSKTRSTVMDYLRHNNPFQKWKRMVSGEPVKVFPKSPIIGKTAPPAGDAAKSLSETMYNAVDKTPIALPLTFAAVAGAGGLGYVGLKNYFDSRRKKKLLAQRDAARKEFAEALLSERETKMGAALEDFVSACEEKTNIKEAGGWETFLGLLGLAAVAGGGMGFYNGLNSEPGNLRKIRALYKARERQNALRDEFEPDIELGLDSVPREKVPLLPKTGG